MNDANKLKNILDILSKSSIIESAPVFQMISMQNKEPFKILISAIISARSRDNVTIKVSIDLFKVLKLPCDVYSVSQETIENIIKPCGFFRQKAKTIARVCKLICDDFNGIIPNDYDTLINTKGLGRKIVNMLFSNAFDKNIVCVDTHVHRISNRLGIINTKNVFSTEKSLEKILYDDNDFKRINHLFVALGQTVCKPIKPNCNLCPINQICKKILI